MKKFALAVLLSCPCATTVLYLLFEGLFFRFSGLLSKHFPLVPLHILIKKKFCGVCDVFGAKKKKIPLFLRELFFPEKKKIETFVDSARICADPGQNSIPSDCFFPSPTEEGLIQKSFGLRCCSRQIQCESQGDSYWKKNNLLSRWMTVHTSLIRFDLRCSYISLNNQDTTVCMYIKKV